MFDYKQIGIKLKANKMTAKGLAELLDINEENLYKWIKGTRITDIDAYNKLENWLSGKVEIVPHEKKEDKRISTLEARCDVLTGVVVELLFATSGESRAIIQKKLDAEVLKILEIGR
jgi:hypothetical protein